MVQKLLAIFAALLMVGCTACLIAGTVTSYWVSSPGRSRHTGLWEYCFTHTFETDAKTCFKIEDRPDFEGWLQAVRVFCLAATIAAGFNVMLLFVYIIKEDGRTNYNRIRVSAVLCIVSSILCLIGVTIFGVKQKQTHFGGVQEIPDFSFYLCMGAGIGLFIVVIPIVVEIVRGRRLGYYESI